MGRDSIIISIFGISKTSGLWLIFAVRSFMRNLHLVRKSHLWITKRKFRVKVQIKRKSTHAQKSCIKIKKPITFNSLCLNQISNRIATSPPTTIVGFILAI